MKPLITIIIPVYNSEDFLEETINSIINQSIGFKNLELLLIDDKSNDNSKYIILDYSEKYDNIKSFLLESNNGTPGKPRNIGIQNASADYIMFCDSDDLYKIDMCETLYKVIKEYNLDFVSSRYNIFIKGEDKGLNRSFLNKYDDMIILNSIEEFPEIIFTLANLNIWNKIYNKNFILKNNIKFNEELVSEDFLFSLEIYLKSNGFSLLTNYSGYIYRDIKTDRITSKTKTYSGLIDDIFLPLEEAKAILKREDFKHYCFFSEIIVINTRLFFKANLNHKEQINILNKFQPYYKKYKITCRLVNIPIVFNIFINIFIKLFSLSNKIPMFIYELINYQNRFNLLFKQKINNKFN